MELLATSNIKSSKLNEALLFLGGIFLLTAASQIEIPLQPVPITLQSVAVMLIGLSYKPNQALGVILSWLGLAACGAPVLAGFSGGLIKFVGPTAGYLFGFAVAAYGMAVLKERLFSNNWIGDLCLTVLGTLALYGFGVAWLSYLMGDFAAAFYAGAVPFILPGIVKVGILFSGLQLVRHFKKG